jgi:signal transduction histidine kinase/ActR/RegA family two-component response regulator
MKPSFDPSIGERLALGFGLLLLSLAVLVGLVFKWHGGSAEAQRTFTRRIAPLAAGADGLERTLLYVGIGLRAHLLNPDADSLRRYDERVDAARSALRALGNLPKEVDGEASYTALASLTERYLRSANVIVERRADGPIDAATEGKLGRERESALAAVRGFADLQERKVREALSVMEVARENVTGGMMVASVLAALFFFAFAYFITQSVRRPVRGLLSAARELENGNWQPVLAWAPAAGSRPARTEMLQLARAFGAAAVALERREQRLRADGRVAAAAAASMEKTQVAEAALRAIVETVHADVGAMYWRETGSDVLQPIALHALGGGAEPVRLGEGLPGQAALEGRPVVSRDIPRDSGFMVKLGYDQAPPRCVAAIPVLFRDEVLGIVLVASLRELDEEALAFLRATGLQLGIGFQNLRSHENVERLLADLRDKTAQIEAQNEELQAQNEEFQAQNEELQAQNEEIQAQNEEIQAQGEEIHEQYEQLQTQAGLLVESDQRKNEFLGLLAHELRNPMAAIAHSIVVLMRGGTGDDRSSRAQMIIDRQTRHLTRLIDDLLDITRISRGKIDLQRERLDLVPLMRECAEDHQPMLDAAGLALELQLPEQGLQVDGDRTRICQVVGNLMSNAIKFSDRGSRIVVTVRREGDPPFAAIQVADSGDGIAPDLLERLFQPFSQGDHGRERKNGGLGLGLALVKALIDLHEGSVEARSDGPGHGARFTVRLPLVPDAAQAGFSRTPSESAAAHKLLRILIVEDNLDAAESLREAMGMHGHRVEMAYTGVEGVEKAVAFRPDVVLCDIGLPLMDGYEVARRLRADASLGPIKLVALSGYASPEDRQRAEQAGFDLHLAKPASIEHLNAILAGFGAGIANL